MKRHKPIPSDFPVRPVRKIKATTKTCGYCDLSWNDSLSTPWTPTPGGRCPFEYFHLYPEDNNEARKNASRSC